MNKCFHWLLTAVQRSVPFLLLSIPALGAPVETSSPADASGGPGATLEEVVVTAQKREQRELDVPVAVTSIDAQSLVESNQVSLQQYWNSIPGLNYTAYGSMGGFATIRGLNSGANAGASTVGFLIDGIPFGSSQGLGAQNPGLDIDPGILQRVEVLRGPQGTLYGASGLGGLINFVTTEPSTEQSSGRIEADFNSISNGDGLGYGGRGVLNMPLSDTFALRANVFARHDPGYIDNTQTGRNGVNSIDADGGGLTALWRPSEAFSLRLNALLQDRTQDGSAFVVPQLGDLTQGFLPGKSETSFGPNTGKNHDSIQSYSGTVTAKLGSVQLLSMTSYSDDYRDAITDNSNPFSTLFQFLSPPLYPAGALSILNTSIETKKFTEEVRLSGTYGSHFDWMLGGFYTHEYSTYAQPDYAAINGIYLQPQFSNFVWWSTYAEIAGFADFTIHFTDQFDIQFGGRESYNRQGYQETDLGPYVPAFEGVPTPAVYPALHSSQGDFTYLVTPQYELTNSLNVYARFASGYRPGGPNFNDYGTLAKEVPPSYGADTTKNYELGVKGEFLDKTLSFDASLYYIDWRNIQLVLFNPILFIDYNANAGSAKSQGLELSIESRPLQGLTLSGWISLNDAQLTEGFPPDVAAYGVSGEALPFSARFSGNLDAQQEFPLAKQVVGFVGARLSYIGERTGAFLASPTSLRQTYSPYATTDLRLGARYKEWNVNLSANNVTDKRAFVYGGGGVGAPNQFVVIQPRTIALSVSRAF